MAIFNSCFASCRLILAVPGGDTPHPDPSPRRKKYMSIMSFRGTNAGTDAKDGDASQIWGYSSYSAIVPSLYQWRKQDIVTTSHRKDEIMAMRPHRQSYMDWQSYININTPFPKAFLVDN